MALPLRNLLSDSYADTLCDHYCDDSNESTICPSSCVSYCPTFCKFDLYSIPPPYADYDPPDSSPEKTHLSLTWVVLIAASAAFAVFFAAALFLKSRRRRPRQSPDPPPETATAETLDREFLDRERGPAAVEHHVWYINTVGLNEAVIESIGVCRYKSGEGLVDGTECSVCLSEFEEDDALRLLPKCGHAFHVACIDTWLRSHVNCPLCRAPIVRENASVSRAGESSVSSETAGEENSGDGVQPIRRSVSMDSISGLKIDLAVLPESNTRRLRSTAQRGSSSSLMRSISCSGRLLLSAHGRSRSRSRRSILPM